jgi:hypothetical protein
MWLAWQAARASLKVKLPDVCDLYPNKMLEREVMQRLEDAGVGYE